MSGPLSIPTRYPHDFKRRVVLYADKFSNREAERKFGIAESNIRRWKKLRPILFSKGFVSENGRRKRLVKRVSNMNTDYLYEIENFVDENDKIIEMPRLVKQVSRQATPTVLSANSAGGSSTQGDAPVEREPEGEEVCIRWNSHHNNMKSVFPYLLQREQYVDVTLTSDGKSLKCHKLILSSCSGYFDELLAGIEPFQHPVIFLNGVPFWLLKAIIDFMYAGEVHIDQNKLPQLLKVAQMLQIKGLTGKDTKPEEDAPPQLEKNEAVIPKPAPEIKSTLPKIIETKPAKPTDTKPIKPAETKIIKPVETKPIKPTETKPLKPHDIKLPSAAPKIPEPKPTAASKMEIKSVTPPVIPEKNAEAPKVQAPKVSEISLKPDEVPRLRVVAKKDVPFAVTQRSIVFKAIPMMTAAVDPMSLLKTAFVEEAESPKPHKDSPKKVNSGKKIKKRKSSEKDLSPPPVVYRKGTKSRPNVRVPRYYHNDYDTVLKKKMLKRELKETLQRSILEDTTFDLANVKSEPLDIEDTDVQFMEITTDDIPEESDLSRDYDATTSSSVDEKLLSVTRDLFDEATSKRFFKIEELDVSNGDVLNPAEAESTQNPEMDNNT